MQNMFFTANCWKDEKRKGAEIVQIKKKSVEIYVNLNVNLF